MFAKKMPYSAYLFPKLSSNIYEEACPSSRFVVS